MSVEKFRLLFSHDELVALGRCTVCGWHPPTQGHQVGCPEPPVAEATVPLFERVIPDDIAMSMIPGIQPATEPDDR